MERTLNSVRQIHGVELNVSLFFVFQIMHWDAVCSFIPAQGMMRNTGKFFFARMNTYGRTVSSVKIKKK
jgi:hypothetical protein